MTTEERLAKVEQELADLRAELAAGLTTRHIEVVGDVGGARVLLDVTADGPMLGLSDEAGNAFAMLAASKISRTLTLFDAAGKTRAMLCVAKYGPSLTLFDAAGKTIWRTP